MTYNVKFNEREFKYVNDLLQIEQGTMATYEIEANFNARKNMTRAFAEVKWEEYNKMYPVTETREYKSKNEFFANEFFIPANEAS